VRNNCKLFLIEMNLHCGGRIFLTLCFVTCSISYENSILPKIIGGSAVTPGEFPWMVSIMLKNENGSLHHICGGTLIDMNFIVTAAHCVIWYYTSDLMILAGANTLHDFEATKQLRQVEQVKIHPQYDYTTRRNDIARLRVNVSFLENEPYISHVSFPPVYHIATGLCTITGWGITAENSESSSNVLNKASLPIVPKSECYGIYQNEFDNNTQICAGLEQGGVDACTGDTGGALICTDLGQKYFAGISSWGYMCALPRHPGVYTEISKFIHWIAS